MMRDIILAANWKMNKSFTEAEDFIFNLTEYLEKDSFDPVKIVICPPALYLEMISDYAVETGFFTGAQDVSVHDIGAFTGEISASMLASMEVDYCIIGHSERRKYHAETDDLIGKKMKILQSVDIIPIVCIGETGIEREQGKTEAIIEQQLSGIFTGKEIKDKIVLAYEPIWAIGTGKTATPDQAQEMHHLIRNWMKIEYSSEFANNLPILYGGSMKPENIKELLSQPDIDGGLIGGASLDFEKFHSMIMSAKILSVG